MTDNRTLTIVYTFFLGIILALFIGLGISTFYEGPKQPEYPTALETSVTKEGPTPEQQAKQVEFEKASRKYEKDYQLYSRNVSMIALVAAVVLLIMSFIAEKRNQVIANGLLLGGVFTLLYSIIRGFVSQDTKYTFVAVSVGLLVALYLGYRRFAAHPDQTPVTKKK